MSANNSSKKRPASGKKPSERPMPPINPRDYLIWIPIMMANVFVVWWVMRLFGWEPELGNTLSMGLSGLLLLAAAFMLQYVENLLANKIRVARGKTPLPPLWVFTAYSIMWRDRNGEWH